MSDSTSPSHAPKDLHRPPPPILHSKRILIADDSMMMRRFFTSILQMAGATCLEAESGTVALGILREYVRSGRPVDLAVLDLKMPGMSGRELLEAIRRDPEFRETPVVIHSTISDREQILECARFGINGYIVKPSLKDKIYEILAEALQEGVHLPGYKVEDSETHGAQGLTVAQVNALRALVAKIMPDDDDPVGQAVLRFLDEHVGEA